MQEFDPVIEASNKIERKKAWMVLGISIFCFIMGFIIAKYFGNDRIIEDFSRYSKHDFFELVYDTGLIWIIIPLVSIGFIIWSIVVLIKYRSSGLAPTIESNNFIKEMGKELNESKDYLDTLAKQKIKKRGDITKDPNADDDEHLSFRKRTNYEPLTGKNTHKSNNDI